MTSKKRTFDTLYGTEDFSSNAGICIFLIGFGVFLAVIGFIRGGENAMHSIVPGGALSLVGVCMILYLYSIYRNVNKKTDSSETKDAV